MNSMCTPLALPDREEMKSVLRSGPFCLDGSQISPACAAFIAVWMETYVYHYFTKQASRTTRRSERLVDKPARPSRHGLLLLPDRLVLFDQSEWDMQ